MTNSEHAEALRAAVYCVVKAAKQTEDAVYRATAYGDYDMKIQRVAGDIERRCEKIDVFRPDYPRILRDYAEALQLLAKAEVRTSVIHDEGDMSGGRTEVHFTDQGLALNGAQAALRNLAAAIDEVFHRLDTERLVQELRVGNEG